MRSSDNDRPAGAATGIAGMAALAALLAVTLNLAGCYSRSETTQIGPRGSSMATITRPGMSAELATANGVPEPLIPPIELEGPRSGDVLQNVQVLGDTSVPQLTRLMTAMVEWVAPEQGCGYCHVANDYAADHLYTKIVARRMLQMTRHVNSNWKDHVAGTGVTCYTCHRGKPVPEYIWYAGHETRETRGLVGRRRGQNLATSPITVSSLPYDPFSSLLLESGELRVQSATPLPDGDLGGRNQTENTYALMMHMSDALGVNCLYCHHSRAFRDWSQSSPARVTAWYGIRMVRDLNSQFLVPLEGMLPQVRLGPHGDGPKVFCKTCHQGVYKPLYGESMLDDYPSLRPGVPGAVEARVEAQEGGAAPAGAGSTGGGPATD